MAIDTSVPYTIVAPALTDGRGGTAVLNDTASADFVGYLVESSGFEGPAVRQNTDPVVEGHGAVHGSFWYGERSFTLNVSMALASTSALSMARLDKLLRATNAMANAGTITWTETGSAAARMLTFRRESPPRGPDPTNRQILISCVSADPRIVSPPTANDTTVTSGTLVTNDGNASYPPLFTLSAPSNPVITNNTTGQSFSMTISGGGTLTIDFANHTATQGGVSRYSSINFATSKWWELVSGQNSITVTGGGTVHMFWRSAWV